MITNTSIGYTSGKISPKLISAGKRLLFTESACFLESDGIELKIPSGLEGNEFTFQFCFDSNKEGQPAIKVDVIDSVTIKISLTNFNNVLGTGTTSPLEFHIGNKKHWLLIYTTSLTGKDDVGKTLINMTVSMYRDDI